MEFGKLTATTSGRTQRIDVRPGSPVIVGRSNHCTLCVPDPKVSREHCRIEFVAGRLRVTDLASSHGLTYRGLKTAGFEIDVGDGFHLGQTFVRFEELATGPDAAPPVEVRRDEPVQDASAADIVDLPHEPEEPVDEPPDEAAYAPVAEPMPEPLPPDVAEQYPAVPVAGRPAGRRRAARSGGFALRLFGQLCLIVTVVITTVAVLLALKNHNPEWDVYKLLDRLRPPK